jgi:hypothetical protein
MVCGGERHLRIPQPAEVTDTHFELLERTGPLIDDEVTDFAESLARGGDDGLPGEIARARAPYS